MKTKQEEQTITEAAHDLLDFCGGQLTMKQFYNFWIYREYNFTNEIKNRVLSMAYQLIINK